MAEADVLAAQRDYDSAERKYQDALRRAEQLMRADPSALKHHALAAGIHRPLGDLGLARRQPDDALRSFEKALGIELSLIRREGPTPERRRLVALTRLRIGDTRAAQGAWDDARDAYREAGAVLRELRDSGNNAPGLERDTAVALRGLARATAPHDRHAASAHANEAVVLLRRLIAADSNDARVAQDLVGALVEYADLMREKDAAAARAAYRDAKGVAESLQRGQPSDPEIQRNLAVIRDRLAAGAASLAPELTLFAVSDAGRTLLRPADSLPPGTKEIAARAVAPEGWTRYLVVFGARGDAVVLDEEQLARSNWRVPVSGPPPAQTMLLLAVPGALPPADRQQLAVDIGSIPGPRAVDWDSQVVWTSEAEPTIMSTASARGALNTDWVQLVRARLEKIQNGKFVGRTIPIPASSR